MKRSHSGNHIHTAILLLLALLAMGGIVWTMVEAVGADSTISSPELPTGGTIATQTPPVLTPEPYPPPDPYPGPLPDGAGAFLPGVWGYP